MKKIRNIVVIGLVSIFFIYTISFLYHAIVETSNNPIVMEKTLPKDYINLFNKIAKQKLVLDLGTTFKLRNNISILIYDKKFRLEVTKINTKQGINLKNDIVESYTKAEGSFYESEWPFNETDFTSRYKGVSTDTASKIYLALQGDSTSTVIKNDSVVCYYLKLKTASVQYQPKDVYQIFLAAKSKFNLSSVQPTISLLFLKSQNSCYFLLLSAINKSAKFEPDMLYKLVAKSINYQVD